LPFVNAGIDVSFCANPNPVDIPLDDPVIGSVPGDGLAVWTGTGIVDTSGIFRTDTAGGVGTYIATVTYTDLNGCINSDDINITVTEPVIPQAFPYDTVCAYANTFYFDNTTFTPTSGVKWYGNGVIDSLTGEYDPSILGDLIPVGGQGVVDTIYMTVSRERVRRLIRRIFLLRQRHKLKQEMITRIVLIGNWIP
jgi:hypothetical protein